MKNDDLERLEQSQGIQQLIRCTKEQYDREKTSNTPPPFSTVRETIRERQTHKQSLRISPWWLTAACLLGWMVGYGFSGRDAVQPDPLAVTDTVIVIHERVDTVYREVKPQTLVAHKNGPQSLPSKRPVAAKAETAKPLESELISLELLQQQLNMPNPESDCYAANGMTIAEDNYPLHLLMTSSSK